MTEAPTRGRPRKPLEKQYGKLTVLRVTRDDRHRRVAVCQCECGALKTVLVPSLYQGFTRSCGARRCRPNGSENGAAAKYRMPLRFTPERLRALVSDRESGRPVAELAAAYDVALGTTYKILRRVVEAGGVESFIQQTRSSSDGEA